MAVRVDRTCPSSWPSVAVAARPSRPFVLASLRALRLDLRSRNGGIARIEEGQGIPVTFGAGVGAVGSCEHKPSRRSMRGRFSRRNAVTNHEQTTQAGVHDAAGAGIDQGLLRQRQAVAITMPPRSCEAAVLALITRPTSNTLSHRDTRISPVSWSTRTSQKCAPARRPHVPPHVADGFQHVQRVRPDHGLEVVLARAGQPASAPSCLGHAGVDQGG
jgi:hypothetical protein